MLLESARIRAGQNNEVSGSHKAIDALRERQELTVVGRATVGVGSSRGGVVVSLRVSSRAGHGEELFSTKDCGCVLQLACADIVCIESRSVMMDE